MKQRKSLFPRRPAATGLEVARHIVVGRVQVGQKARTLIGATAGLGTGQR
jgi:hypothetical protein